MSDPPLYVFPLDFRCRWRQAWIAQTRAGLLYGDSVHVRSLTIRNDTRSMSG